MHPVAVSYAVYNLSKKAGIRPAHIHKLRHCIHPNTRIVVPEGVLPAKMLYFRHSPIMAYDFNNLKVVEAEVVDKTMHVSDKMVAILAGGRELICTPEHRVFRLRNGKIEEVEAGKLSVGDYIAGVRRIEVPNRRKIFEPKLWRILGYIIGDGYVHGRTTVNITEKREDIANYYLNLARGLGFNVGLKKYEDRKSYLLTIYSTALVDLAVSLGMDKKSPGRRIPIELFHATDEEIIEFIAGFYDAEGLEVRKESEFPRFFNTSKEMLKDIQILLLYFGVHSILQKRVRKVKTPHGKIYEQHKIYEICIVAGDEIEKFSKLIPTLKTVNVTSTRSKRHPHDIIPVADVLKQIYERRLREGKIVVKYGAALSKYVRELRNPSRNALANLLKIIEDEPEYKFLKGLVEGNIMWLKVTKIERTGGNARSIKEKELSVGHYLVYDFDVPSYNTLITDGIISHNSRVAHLRLKGVPLDVLSKFLGHEKLDTTMIYAHIGPPVIQKEIPPPFT
jgi:intein/homing endonuclease